MPYILLFISLALSQGCISDNPQFDRIIQSLPSFMIQMGQETRFQSGGNIANDFCYATAIDPQDEGIYCAGVTNGPIAEANGGIGTFDAFILKFSRDKKLLWARQFGAVTFGGENALAESFSSIAFDSKGFVYASGSLNNQGVIAKFSRKGDVVYRRVHSASANCVKLIIRNDRLFCTGPDSAQDFAIVYEIDQNGNVLWQTQTTGGKEYPYDMVMDRAGNLIITGITGHSFNPLHVPDPGKVDVLVWKVSSAGTELWVDQFGTNGFDEYGASIAIDKFGKIVVGGSFFGSGLMPPDLDFDPTFSNQATDNSFVASFRDTGTGISEKWLFRTHHSGQSYVQDLIVTADNNIIAGGTTQGFLFETQASGTLDSYIAKISSTGILLGGIQFGLDTRGNGDNTNFDSCNALAEDPLGNIVCGGNSAGSPNETNAGSSDIMIWRVNSDLSF